MSPEARIIARHRCHEATTLALEYWDLYGRSEPMLRVRIRMVLNVAASTAQ
jgi:hypothetical protein